MIIGSRYQRVATYDILGAHYMRSLSHYRHRFRLLHKLGNGLTRLDPIVHPRIYQGNFGNESWLLLQYHLHRQRLRIHNFLILCMKCYGQSRCGTLCACQLSASVETPYNGTRKDPNKGLSKFKQIIPNMIFWAHWDFNLDLLVEPYVSQHYIPMHSVNK